MTVIGPYLPIAPKWLNGCSPSKLTLAEGKYVSGSAQNRTSKYAAIFVSD